MSIDIEDFLTSITAYITTLRGTGHLYTQIFANRIKIESSDQNSFQDTIKGSGCNPSNIKSKDLSGKHPILNQAFKKFGRNDQEIYSS